MAIAAMVLGIVSLVIPFAGIGTAIVGLILGVLAQKKQKDAGFSTGMATAGIVCSIISLAISVILLLTCWLPLCGAGCALCNLANPSYW